MKNKGGKCEKCGTALDKVASAWGFPLPSYQWPEKVAVVMLPKKYSPIGAEKWGWGKSE